MIGLKTGSHYQSLLYDDEQMFSQDENSSPEINFDQEEFKDKNIEDKIKDDEQIFSQHENSSPEIKINDEKFEDKNVSNKDDKDLDFQQCPVCKKKFKQVLKHISQYKNCSSKIDKKDLEDFNCHGNL